MRAHFEEFKQRLALSQFSWKTLLMRLLETALVTVFLATVAFFSLDWAFSAIVHNRKEVPVPDITKKSSMAALQLLSPKGLSLRFEGTEFDANVPVGSVIRQNPPAGTIVREGKAIRAWFSQGGETVFAPNLVGLTIRNSEMLLRQSQLILGEVSESHSLHFEKGVVMAQEPKADSSLSKNAMMNVVVSAGPPPSGIMLMPDFVQKPAEDANKWAKDAGIILQISEDPASLFPAGTVLSQSPAPDAVLSKDSKVELTVSKRGDAGASQAKVHRIHYELPQGGAQNQQVRIVLLDQAGEHEVFNGFRGAGSKVDLTAPYNGPAKARTFVNGILVEEKEMP